MEQPNETVFDSACNRIEEAMSRYGQSLPEPVAYSLAGYCAALLEWGLVSVSEHDHLQDRIAVPRYDPVAELFLGYPASTPDAGNQESEP